MWNIIIPWKSLSDGLCGISLFLGNPFLMVYVEYHYSLVTPFRWSMWNIIIPWKPLSDGLCEISLFIIIPWKLLSDGLCGLSTV